MRHAPVVSLKVPLDPKTGGRAKEGIQLELGTYIYKICCMQIQCILFIFLIFFSECKVEANPNEVTYKWFLNDEPIPGNHSTKLVS